MLIFQLLLSAAVSPSKLVIDQGYDVPTVARYLDWIAVMTYGNRVKNLRTYLCMHYMLNDISNRFPRSVGQEDRPCRPPLLS